mmetsp:Transcript_12069/g.31934  ORF Transcript_12069/g.31934 Transcript_12069/m.31934 type:complete len:212 (+) Transcript_12069:167-802(+)
MPQAWNLVRREARARVHESTRRRSYSNSIHRSSRPPRKLMMLQNTNANAKTSRVDRQSSAWERVAHFKLSQLTQNLPSTHFTLTRILRSSRSSRVPRPQIRTAPLSRWTPPLQGSSSLATATTTNQPTRACVPYSICTNQAQTRRWWYSSASPEVDLAQERRDTSQRQRNEQAGPSLPLLRCLSHSRDREKRSRLPTPPPSFVKCARRCSK